jgi:hypothetical protein
LNYITTSNVLINRQKGIRDTFQNFVHGTLVLVFFITDFGDNCPHQQQQQQPLQPRIILLIIVELQFRRAVSQWSIQTWFV